MCTSRATGRARLVCPAWVQDPCEGQEGLWPGPLTWSNPALPTRTASASPLPESDGLQVPQGSGAGLGMVPANPFLCRGPTAPALQAGEGQGPGWFLVVLAHSGHSGTAEPDGRFRVSSALGSPTSPSGREGTGQ